MKTKSLNDWQRAAIVESVRHAIGAGVVHRESGEALLRDLDAALHIRLSFPNDVNPR